MEFGQDYRREVQDINEGRSKATESTSAVTTNQASAGKETEVLDTRGKREGIQGLVGFAAQTLTGINIKQQREEYQNAYATSVDTAQAELDKTNEKESGWMSVVFGKSATQRGLHKRVLETETSNYHLQQLKRLPADVRNYKDATAYQKGVLNPALQNALSKQTDPKMRADIISHFSSVSEGLGRQYVNQRAAYEQVLNRKATLEGVTSKINLFRTSKESGNAIDSSRLEKDVISEFTKPRHGMDAIAHQDTVVNAVLRDVGQGHPEGIQLIEMLQKEGKIKLDVENQDKINAAKEVWIKDNDMALTQKTYELDHLLTTQAPNFEEVLQAAKARYGNNINVNNYRDAFEKRRLDVVAEQAQVEQDVTSLANGEAVPDKARSAKAAKAIQSRIGSRLVLSQNQALLARQQAKGLPEDQWVDVYAAPTEEQQLNAIIDHPEEILNTWAATQTALPVVTQSHVRLSALLNQEKNTDADAAEIERLMQFHDQLDKRDPVLFAQQAPSKGELSRNTALSWLRSAGQSPRQAIQTLRTYAKRPDYKWNFEDDELGEAADDALDEVEKSVGFTFTDSVNRDAVLWEAKSQVDQAIKIYKDPELAKVIAAKQMMRNGARIGNQFVPGGGKVDKKSILPTTHYNKLLPYSKAFMDKKEGRGFPRNIPLDDPRITITPYKNYGGFTYSMDSPVDGSYIYLSVDSAKSQADLPVVTKKTYMDDLYEQSILENLQELD